jgi:8-oxo-dGTP pyrophosphatase MutT (NUDIX family)
MTVLRNTETQSPQNFEMLCEFRGSVLKWLSSMSEPGSSRENPLIRPSARVVLFDPDQRVLLFRVTEPGRPTAKPFWITGGGVEGEETFEECARREVLEETGIEDVELGPVVWLREHTWPWGKLWIHSVERFFAGRTRQPVVRTHLQLQHELQFLSEHRWWTPDEMRSAEERLVPAEMAQLLVPLLGPAWPSEPVVVGE